MVWTMTMCAALGQQSPLAEGLVPYQFTFTNGEPTLYALVNEDNLNQIAIPVLIDEPWNKRAYTITIQSSFIDEMDPELSAPRRERLRRKWEAAGGIELRDRDGNDYWVLQSDLEKHNRAEALVESAFPIAVEAEPVTQDVVHGLEEGGVGGPGFVRLWWPHVAIAGGAAVLISGVAWLTFRRSWSPT